MFFGSSEFSPLAYSPIYWGAPRLSVVESSGKVSSLPDHSGNGNDLTEVSGSAQPTYTSSNADFNSIATVDFNGSHKLVNSSLSSSITDATYFIVYRINSIAVNGDTLISSNLVNQKRMFYGTGNYSDGTVRNGGGDFGSTFQADINETHIVMFQCKSSEITATINDGAVITDSAVSSTTDELALGYSIALNGRYVYADVAELIVYPSNLTTDEAADVRNYLNDIYARW